MNKPDIHIYLNGALKHDLEAIKQLEAHIDDLEGSGDYALQLIFMLQSMKFQLIYKIKSIGDVLKTGYGLELEVPEYLKEDFESSVDPVIISNDGHMSLVTNAGTLEGIGDVIERVKVSFMNKDVGKDTEDGE